MFIENLNFWDYIKTEERPIVLYGMGDASQKIFNILKSLDVEVSDIFASDEFVRGHSFLGYKVKKFSEICKSYDDCVILVCFATFIPEVINRIKEISEKYDTYAPYISMFGDELCTNEFIKNHRDDILKAREILADEKSKTCFDDVINYMISGKCKYLFNCQSEREEVFEDIIKFSDDESFLDLGAYNGDTILEFVNHTDGRYKKIYAFEPDVKNFKKLEKTIAENNIDAEIHPYASWSGAGEISFAGKGGRNSTIGDGYVVKTESIDNIIIGQNRDISYIKMDVEGAERETLLGGKMTIKKFSPKLIVSAYHKVEDIFYLVNLINEINPDYKIYLRHHPYIPAFETNIYAVI